MPALEVLAKLRAVVGNDPYAGTFQSFGHYRSAILKHIDNLAAGMKLGGRKPELESDMNTMNQMPLAASAYDPEHPFPEAVRRVDQLERAILSGVIVQLDALTTYTASPYGGMRQDPQGPWVAKLDVMGQARSAHPDGEALALFAAKMHGRLFKARKQGRAGWDNPAECTTASLARLLMLNVATGDHVSVGNYAMMLEQRGADPGVLADALEYYVRHETAAPACTRDSAETFAQALIAQGWHSADPACVDGLETLLRNFMGSACKVSA